MVYISKEYTNSREKWENLIKNYNLEGYHFICNKKFIEDFEQKVSKIYKYPTFMIVDKSGKVLDKDAPYPSDGKKLKRRIKGLLVN